VVIAAIGVLACIVYLAGGRLDIGTSSLDLAFTPALSPVKQLSFAIDVPNGHRITPSTLAARMSLAMARGRRTALRDLAAVSSALTIVMFGVWLRAAGLHTFPIAITMLAMMMAPTSWWRGVSWNGDALTPALAAAALWAAQGKRWIIAALLAIAAIVDGLDHFGLIAGLSAEFTMLGFCLIAIGTLSLMAKAVTRTRVIVAAITIIVLYVIRLTDIPLVLGGWAAVAVGITWLLRSTPGPHAIVTVVALVLIAGPSLTRARLSALGGDLDSSLGARAAYEVRPADLPSNAAIIAESRRVDAVLRLSSIAIVPQTAEDVDAALGGGKTLLAFPNARANLETLGFLFERAFIGNVPVAVVAGHAPCIELVKGEWRDVSMLTAARSFTLHGPTYDSAPGGIMMHVTHPQPARITAIEPRSITFEIENAGDLTAIHVPHTGREDAVTVTLESPPVSAVARADDDHAVRMCAGALTAPLLLGRTTASAQLRMNDYAPFVSGWHPIEADPDFFRWTAAPDATVRVAIAPVSDIRITVTATPASRPAQHPSIALSVNHCRFDPRPMQAGQGDYEWIAGKDCWRDGFNQLAISTSPLISPAALFATHDDRLLGARIGAIRLFRMQNK
jgi:hypothetical protein